MVDKRRVLQSLRFLSFVSFIIFTQCSGGGGKHRVNVILVGATGDLAKRYLWQGLFNLFLSAQSDETTFRFYGGSRGLDTKEGNVALQEILKTSIKCSEDSCERKKVEFSKLCIYLRLRFESDYEDLQGILKTSLVKGETEIGRIFYLSVPPFAYEAISQHINSKCRQKDNNIWMKVVLEKPFGSDFNSAQELSKKLSRYWKEEEIYRNDHYLGKPGVRQILEFRNKNKLTLEPIWNKDFIEQVHIVLKEKLDVEGRMGFYDHYGVIRDIFQNHLTEILLLITSELSNDNSKISLASSKKLELLRSLRVITPDDAVFGQYKEYNSQLHKEIPDQQANSSTPTFSAVCMHIDNDRWFGVPFVLMSGKRLDAQTAYIQVQFKRNKFCVSNNITKNSNCAPSDIIFYIQGENLGYPVTLVSRSLPVVNIPDDWDNVVNITSTFPLFQGDKVVMRPRFSYDAYSSLIRDVFLGNKDMFIGIEDLLLSWKVWTPLLEMSSSTKPKLYTGDHVDELDFEIMRGKMKYISDRNMDECHESKTSYFNKYQDPAHMKSHSFRGNKLVSGSTLNVVQKLANDIREAVQLKVQSGRVFHLALSGGSSPQQLFQILAFSMDALPWQHIHIWIVDERCVSLTDDQSNFKNIYESLLKHVNIPFVNIHPMPVDMAGRLCHKEDKADVQYEELLKYYLGDNSLDFVVLGVGRDGHTASLFPNQSSLEITKWVEITSGNSSQSGSSRMTFTLQVLNKSKKIAVLVLGVGKQEIVNELLSGVVDVNKLPITGVEPLNGSLSWYIDEYALPEQ